MACRKVGAYTYCKFNTFLDLKCHLPYYELNKQKSYIKGEYRVGKRGEYNQKKVWKKGKGVTKFDTFLLFMLEQMIFYLLPDKESIGDKKVIFLF